jgi:restriction system protein
LQEVSCCTGVGTAGEGDATVTSKYMANWREYQERVVDLFRELGCSVEVEASVEGVRASHDIDVWVVFERFGLEHRWAIECKYWDKPIPKEKVLTLRSIVDDVGADKGILVAESGFQSGARDATSSTNILLTTLSKLRSLAEHDLQRTILEELGGLL